MPRGLIAHAATAMGGKIYVTGGRNGGNSVSSVYVYDSQADAWTQLASMGFARRTHAFAAVRGKLYVFGGLSAFDNIERLSTAEVYDPNTDSWAQESTLTSPRSAMVAVAL